MTKPRPLAATGLQERAMRISTLQGSETQGKARGADIVKVLAPIEMAWCVFDRLSPADQDKIRERLSARATK